MALEGALNSFDFTARVSKRFAIDFKPLEERLNTPEAFSAFSAFLSDSVGNQMQIRISHQS